MSELAEAFVGASAAMRRLAHELSIERHRPFADTGSFGVEETDTP